MLDKYIGKTLEEIASDVGTALQQGIAVFELQDEKDTIGLCVDEDFTINLILQKHPRLSTKIIKHVNYFYDMYVFRVI